MVRNWLTETALKVSIFGVFLGRIFTHSDWIRRNTPYFSVFSPNAGKYGPEKLPIRTLFHALRVLSWVDEFSWRKTLKRLVWINFLELVVLCESNTPNCISKIHFHSIDFQELAKETRNRYPHEAQSTYCILSVGSKLILPRLLATHG